MKTKHKPKHPRITSSDLARLTPDNVLPFVVQDREQDEPMEIAYIDQKSGT